MVDVFTCPRCGRSLNKSGEVTIEGETLPVFQCDQCIVSVSMFGTQVEAALTFAVDKNGRAFDPASEDGCLPGS
jgi:transcription elongation factor Elf1